jgi:excinuclease UvrABC nuclease subunit
MIWKSEHEKDVRVQDKSGWINLDDYKKIEGRSGVYIFADNNKDVKYIGKAGAGRLVLEYLILFEIYSAMYRGKGLGATIVKGLYTNSGKAALSLEKSLIQIYNPIQNINLIKD